MGKPNFIGVTMDAFQKNKVLYVGFITLALIHLLLALFTPFVNSESTDYQMIASNVAAGRGLYLPTGELYNRYPPVYPFMLGFQYFLANVLSIKPVWITSIFSIVFLVFGGKFLMQIIAELGGSLRIQILGFIIFLFQPYILYLSFNPLSATPFITLFIFLIFKLLQLLRTGKQSPQSWATIGFILGVLALIRPIAVGLPVLLSIVLLFRKFFSFQKRLLLTGILFITFFITISPWTVLNSCETGHFQLLSSGGVPSLRDGLSFNHKSFREPLSLPKRVEKYSNDFYAIYAEMNSVGKILNYTFKKLTDNPFEVFQVYGYKALRSWYGTDSQNGKLEFVNILITLFVLLFSFPFVKKWLIQNTDFGGKMYALILLFTLLYFWFMTTVFLSIVRYMLPVFVLFSIPMAFFIDQQIQKKTPFLRK